MNRSGAGALVCAHVRSVALGGRHEVRGQLGGQVVAVDLDVDEVHGERELVLVQEAVLVDVRQLPDLAEHRVRQLRLHHLRLGGCRQTPGQLVGAADCVGNERG